VLRELRLEALGPAHERPLAELFEANDVPSVTRWFDPFPLNRETARALSHHRGRDLFWGAWEGPRLVGFAMARGWDGGHPDPAYGCFVDRGNQGREVGRTLTALALEALAHHGVEEIRTRVHADNDRSLRMFRAAGFAELERTAGRVLLLASLGRAR
jgi:RimJ/RimL family protein N-acetyltransferase